MNFASKSVVITGAASGIGKAIAKHFAKASADLSLLDIDEDNLLKVVEECEQLGSTRVIKVVVDVSKDADLEQAMKKIKQEMAKIDVLVNCAGVGGTTCISDPQAISQFDRVMNINLRSVFATAHFALPALIESKGCIVNISSVLSQFIHKDAIGYCVSKAGITQLTKCIALDVAQYGVRVNCIAPGAVRTNIIINKGASKEENDRFWLSNIKKTALKRTVKVEEVAELVVYLASDKATSITGVEYIIDCGFSVATNS